jgi:addiction module HigA family antidote
MTIKLNMKPEHPGGVILNWILPEGMTITEAAKRLGVSRQSLDALVNERRSVSPEMAKRLELTFGGTARTLLNMQTHYDLAKVEERVSELAEEVEPYDAG